MKRNIKKLDEWIIDKKYNYLYVWWISIITFVSMIITFMWFLSFLIVISLSLGNRPIAEIIPVFYLLIFLISFSGIFYHINESKRHKVKIDINLREDHIDEYEEYLKDCELNEKRLRYND